MADAWGVSCGWPAVLPQLFEPLRPAAQLSSLMLGVGAGVGLRLRLGVLTALPLKLPIEPKGVAKGGWREGRGRCCCSDRGLGAMPPPTLTGVPPAQPTAGPGALSPGSSAAELPWL